MHAVTTADINPVLAATTDRKNKLEKPAALSLYYSGEKNQAGLLQPVSADFQKSFLEYYNKRPIMPRS